MLRIALTGGIASGKSTVADLFALHGAPVIRTDEIARDVVAAGSSGLQQVIDHFGPEFLDKQGQLDRARLRSLVFADPAAREKLESILHPLIRREVLARLDALEESKYSYAIVEIPLLLESGQRDDYDKVVVVDCSATTQVARLAARDGMDESEARQALGAQADRGQRRAIADHVIENDDASSQEMADQVAELDRQFRTAP